MEKKGLRPEAELGHASMLHVSAEGSAGAHRQHWGHTQGGSVALVGLVLMYLFLSLRARNMRLKTPLSHCCEGETTRMYLRLKSHLYPWVRQLKVRSAWSPSSFSDNQRPEERLKELLRKAVGKEMVVHLARREKEARGWALKGFC